MSKRREYLGALATGLAVSAGGCLSDGGEGPSDETEDEPTDDDATDTASGEPTETETGDGTGESGATPLEGLIDITGSSTVYPLAQAVVERFRQQEPEVTVALSRTGTGGGFSEQFCTGASDFNNASREISYEQEERCADNGVESHEIRLAVGAITVIINADNDWVNCITTDDLREIWREDGATRWSDVRDDWPDEEIQRYGPTDTSGTFDYFREAVVGENANHTSDYASTEQDDVIVRGVESDVSAIGYLGFSYYRDNSDAVRALGIDDGDGCVGPSLDTAANGEYPLARPLFTYVNTDRLGEAHVAEFARFFVEQSANEELVADVVGYVPNSQARMQDELNALNDVIADAQ